jgi:rare lipoprotein A
MPHWRSPQINCGSELARDGGGTFNVDIEADGLFASRLAPTVCLALISN